MWQWLLEHHLWDALVAAFATWGVAGICGVIVRYMIIDNWNALMRTQDQIVDLLDTNTPGGLGDIIAAGPRDSAGAAGDGPPCEECRDDVDPEQAALDAARGDRPEA